MVLCLSQAGAEVLEEEVKGKSILENSIDSDLIFPSEAVFPEIEENLVPEKNKPGMNTGARKNVLPPGLRIISRPGPVTDRTGSSHPV